MRVIIIEDDYIVADHLRMILQENSVEVLGILDNVEDAIESIKLKPDLYFIDIRLLGEKRIYKNISYALDYKINLSKPNYRTNLILCQDKAKPIDDESMYISYRPRNRGVSTGLTGKEFNNVYVHSTEYKKYPIYKNTTNPYKLAKLACFGPKSTPMNEHSLQAIDCFASGKPYFQVFSEGDYYQLSFKNIFLTRNRFPTSFLKSEFEPKVTTQKDKTSIMSESIFI